MVRLTDQISENLDIMPLETFKEMHKKDKENLKSLVLEISKNYFDLDPLLEIFIDEIDANEDYMTVVTRILCVVRAFAKGLSYSNRHDNELEAYIKRLSELI